MSASEAENDEQQDGATNR